MLRGLAHFLRHAPATLALSRRIDHAELYEVLMERADAAGLTDWRRELARDLSGHVLEVGCGTGLQFPFYAPELVVTAIEPDERFLPRARAAAPRAAARIRIVRAVGEALPFPDGRFDAIVLAAVLCSVGSVDLVLTELRRVLAPGGRLRLLEHVRSERPVAGAFMDLANPLWRVANRQGCNMNRRLGEPLARAGFRCDRVEGLRIWSAGLPAFPMRFLDCRRA